MKNKCTSYETSKRLLELGFKSETHCGWWQVDKEITGEEVLMSAKFFLDYEKIQLFFERNQVTSNIYKAYDCHDLLMWLKKRTTGKLFLNKNFNFDADFMFFKEKYQRHYLSESNDEQPQEALAKAVIKILKEREE